MTSESKSAHRDIESAIEIAEEDRKRKILNYRLDLARRGIVAYRNGQIVEAVRAFKVYLKLLEESKNVVEGELLPNVFDQKKEFAELVMLSGVYWDLVKIYDKGLSPDLYNQFLAYLDKYILFCRGFPHQRLCSETLRKYLRSRRPVHRADLKVAYESICLSKCFVVASLIDVLDPETLLILRDFRDRVLSQTFIGKRFISWYYRNGPWLAAQMNASPPFFRRFAAFNLDALAYFLQGAMLSKRLMDNGAYSIRSENELAIREADPKG